MKRLLLFAAAVIAGIFGLLWGLSGETEMEDFHAGVAGNEDVVRL